LLQALISFLTPQFAGVEDRQALDIREFTLSIFRLLVSYDKTLLTDYKLKDILSNLYNSMQQATEVDEDLKSLFKKEQDLVIEVLKAA
jgi:hypothetical protein